MSGDDRITFRDDLDGLDDDETLVEDPELRRAKKVLALAVIVVGGIFIALLLVFFQPEGTRMIERWPNGYPKTETSYIRGVSETGRIPHGRHRAWYEDGTLAEEGRYKDGAQVGEWSYWNPLGQLDEARSGRFEAGVRTGRSAQK